jgi:hypothetical protein
MTGTAMASKSEALDHSRRDVAIVYSPAVLSPWRSR